MGLTKFLCLLFFYQLTTFIDPVSTKVTIFTKSTAYAEGANVTLSCKTNITTDTIRWVIIRVGYQNTMTVNCRVKPHDRIRLRQENCDIVAGWYNLTIEGITFADRGIYECSNGQTERILIDVYAYQKTDPVLTVDENARYVEDKESDERALDLRPRQPEETYTVKLHCVTDCGHPAPAITWYGIRGSGLQEPIVISTNHGATVATVDCPVGLSRYENSLTLTAQAKDPQSTVQNITCEARQNFTQYQGKVLIKTAAQKVIYAEETVRKDSWTIPVIIIVVVIIVAVIISVTACGLFYRRLRSQLTKATNKLLHWKDELDDGPQDVNYPLSAERAGSVPSFATLDMGNGKI